MNSWLIFTLIVFGALLADSIAGKVASAYASKMLRDMTIAHLEATKHLEGAMKVEQNSVPPSGELQKQDVRTLSDEDLWHLAKRKYLEESAEHKDEDVVLKDYYHRVASLLTSSYMDLSDLGDGALSTHHRHRLESFVNPPSGGEKPDSE